MEEIFDIVIFTVKKYRNIKIEKTKSMVVLKDGFILKIAIKKGKQNKINLFYYWNMGIIGKILFKKKYRNMIKIIDELKSVFQKKGLKVSPLTKNG